MFLGIQIFWVFTNLADKTAVAVSEVASHRNHLRTETEQEVTLLDCHGVGKKVFLHFEVFILQVTALTRVTRSRSVFFSN